MHPVQVSTAYFNLVRGNPTSFLIYNSSNLQYALGEPVIVSSLIIREMHFIISGEAVIVPIEISQQQQYPTKVKEKASDSNVRNEQIEVSSTVSPLSDHIRGKGSHVGAPLVVIPDHAKPILKQEVVLDSILCQPSDRSLLQPL